MPILASSGVPTLPPLAVDVVDDRRYEFESLDGLSDFVWGGNECFVMPGAEGLDVPPRELSVVAAGDGVFRLDTIQDTPRDVFMPLFVSGRDHLAMLGVAGRLRRFMDYRTRDYRAADGTFDLVAYCGGSPRRLRCAYKSGLGVTSSTLGDWAVVGLELTAVWPYWRGAQWTTPVVRLPVPSPFLSNNVANVWPRKLSRSTALGQAMPLTVGGDVPTAPIIELWGPTTGTTITSPAGLSVVIGTLVTNDYLLIDTGRNRDVALNGVSQSGWAKVARGARWDPFPPGATTVTIAVTGATSASGARVYGESLFESPWAT